MMKRHILEDAASVASVGAATIAAAAKASVEQRGRFLFAVSGGRTPWVMLRELAKEKLPWSSMHLFQVDERAAPADSPDRNFTHLKESLLDHVPLPAENVYPMPVDSPDLAAGAAAYADALAAVAGSPPVLDLVHLGLGPDGHTASLVPDDPVLDVTDALTAVTGPYQGHPRMTLTYCVLDATRLVVFVVDGAAKADALSKLMAMDPSIPAGRLKASDIMILADRAAAAGDSDNG